MSHDFDDASVTEKPGRALAATQPAARPRFGLRSLFIATMAICVVLAVLVPTIPARDWHLSESNVRTKRSKLPSPSLTTTTCTRSFLGPARTPPMAQRCTVGGCDSVHISNRNMHFAATIIENAEENGPTNRLLKDANHGPVAYRCPAPTISRAQCTNYVMLIDDRPGKPNGPPNLPGSVPPSFDDKSAVIVIEIADSDIHWMEAT